MNSPSPLPAGTRWWILCRVIDNFGDAGVAWRLARQLAREHGAAVTLFIDEPALVARLAGPRGTGDVVVAPWPDEHAPPPSLAGARPDVLVSAFGCDPPAWMRALLAGAPARPLWLHLEYLSAEPWVDGCHGLVSVKPSDGAVEHFFYPGFTVASGGLLRERDAVAPDAPDAPDAVGQAGTASAGSVTADSGERRQALQALCGQSPEPGEQVVTLFCYPDAPLAAWLPALAEGDRPTLLLVPEGVAPGAIEAFAGEAPGAMPVRRGRLRIARIPFVSQDDYDRLLRLADINFVRGEDSWIRAHWARRPFVWQPYRQEEFAHLVKLAAFLERLRAAALAPPSRAAPSAGKRREGIPSPGTDGNAEAMAAAVGAIDAMMRAWSGDGDPAQAWRDLERQAAAAAVAFRRWTDALLAQPDLASRLARWVADRL